MELVDRRGGMGIIQFDAKEVNLLGKMRALADNEYKYILGCSRYPQTQEFSGIIRDLFPEFPLQSSYSVYNSKERSYYFKPFAPYRELGIDATLPASIIPLTHSYHAGQCRLDIILPDHTEQNRYPVSVVLLDAYTPSNVTDDVVKILGERETPVLRGFESLGEDRLYGIADVPRLGKVLKLYEKSTELVKNVESVLGVTKDQLKVLRRDGLEHENVVIRDLSRERYQKELQRLVNY